MYGGALRSGEWKRPRTSKRMRQRKISFLSTALLLVLRTNWTLFQVMSEIHTLKEKGSTGRALYKKAKAHFDSRVKAVITNVAVVVVTIDN